MTDPIPARHITDEASVDTLQARLTDEQISAGAKVLAGYKKRNLNWRNAAIDVFEAMTAAASVAQVRELSDEEIVRVWQSMPGSPSGWLKSFGFLQFARAVLAAQNDGAA
jgi:hypothetical protein